MKALVLNEVGSIRGLKYQDVPDPVAAAGEAVVRLRASALNHRDVFICRGLYPNIKPPLILGSDGSGVVESVGSDAEKSWVGREVVINPCFEWGDDPAVQSNNFRILGLPDPGTNAQKIKVPVANLFKKPAHLSFEEAAALPLAGLTAYRAVVTKAKVRSGETILVTGIGGGVAQLAMQIAIALGATVFVTSGNDEKIGRASQLGAAGGVNYHSNSWAKEVAARSDGGPDVVIDGTGGEAFNKSLEALRIGGRLVSYGSTLGAADKVEIRRIFWKQATILGTTMGTDAEFFEMLNFFEENRLAPVVDTVTPLSSGMSAYEAMQESRQFGKLVLSTE